MSTALAIAAFHTPPETSTHPPSTSLQGTPKDSKINDPRSGVDTADCPRALWRGIYPREGFHHPMAEGALVSRRPF